VFPLFEKFGFMFFKFRFHKYFSGRKDPVNFEKYKNICLLFFCREPDQKGKTKEIKFHWQNHKRSHKKGVELRSSVKNCPGKNIC